MILEVDWSSKNANPGQEWVLNKYGWRKESVISFGTSLVFNWQKIFRKKSVSDNFSNTLQFNDYLNIIDLMII